MVTFFVRSVLCALVLGLLLVRPVHAQDAQDPEVVIEQIREAYRQLEYEQAEQIARDVLSEYQQLTIDQLWEVHRLLGLIEISQNDRAAAQRHFEAALSLNPDLALDPTFVSPKIIDFFQQVRRAYLAETARSVSDSVAIRYRLIRDPRPEAALRSALLPGWGQLYKGETGKGRLLMGIWGASTGGALLAHIFGRLAENDGGALPATSDNGEDHAEWWNGARNGLVAMAVGTWLVSYLDALLTGGGPVGTPQMLITPDRDLQPHVTLRIRF